MEQQDYKKEYKYIKAKEKIRRIKEFYWHLATYILVVPLLIFINLKFVPQFHWFWFSALGWGVGLANHAFQVFNGFTLFFGKDWEERKVKEYMDNDNL